MSYLFIQKIDGIAAMDNYAAELHREDILVEDPAIKSSRIN